MRTIKRFAFSLIFIILTNTVYCQIGKIVAKTPGRVSQFDTIRIFKETKGYKFCLVPGLLPEYVDSIIGPDTLIVMRLIENTFCKHFFGPFRFYKKKNLLYMEFFDSVEQKVVRHKQYSLKYRDTTNSRDIFEYRARRSGYNSYVKDTLFITPDSQRFHCYAFNRSISNRQGQKVFFATILVDKKLLFPVLEIYYDRDMKEMTRHELVYWKR